MVHVSKCAIHGSYEYWILTPYRVVTFSKQSGKNGKNTLMALEGLLFLKQKDVFFLRWRLLKHFWTIAVHQWSTRCKYIEYINITYKNVLSVLWFQRCLLHFLTCSALVGMVFSFWLRIYIDSCIHYIRSPSESFFHFSAKPPIVYRGCTPIDTPPKASTEPSNGCAVDDVFPFMVLFFQVPVPVVNFQVSK